MAKSVISPQERIELGRLWKEYDIAIKRRSRVLRAKGMDSVEFLAADAEFSAIVRRVREIVGATD